MKKYYDIFVRIMNTQEWETNHINIMVNFQKVIGGTNNIFSVPVIPIDQNKFMTAFPNESDIAYTWYEKGATSFRNDWSGQVVELELVKHVITYHTFAYHGLFRPTVQEVRNQVNFAEYIDLEFSPVVYFTTCPMIKGQPMLEKHAGLINVWDTMKEEEKHIATTYIYQRKS
jgi:hypothetical protein